MRFDDLLASDAEAVEREVSGVDLDAILTGALDALGVVRTPDAATGTPARHRVGRGPIPGGRDDRPDVDDELIACLRRAGEGDPASARRVAELLELQERAEEAVAWWCRAAEAGDRDAIAYLREKSR
ncbi:hypothetical protein [Saccharothrix syringae]|uniref:Sel1 repeat family protein n=1 Tax=Saccharothrix syringae TaxID=103733 RepID=A0A5Q0H9B7_SACSY|nr:hypothetical protein [Saccharothrix syringae]QFZ22789.1 hypothetical protein EKG83_39965 [Saccharothrix syringae]